MINNKNDLNEYLAEEKIKYGVRCVCLERIKMFLGAERSIIFFFQRRLRKTEYYKNTGKNFRYLLSTVLLNRYRTKYSLNIGLNVFGKGLKIMHLGPILTNGKAEVGENCSVHVGGLLLQEGGIMLLQNLAMI